MGINPTHDHPQLFYFIFSLMGFACPKFQCNFLDFQPFE